MKEITIDVNMILAGDVGGTKTLLGLFDVTHERPEPVLIRPFTTTDFPDLSAAMAAFSADAAFADVTIRSAAFGVAGPVVGGTATLTNVPFRIDAADISRRFQIADVRLLNDLEAMAYSVAKLRDSEIHV